MKIFKEENHGTTRVSTEYLETKLKLIGEVVSVIGKKDEDLEYWVIFKDADGNEIVTSGFSWGYGGEGPHGLLQALHGLGWNAININDIAGIKEDHFTITNEYGAIIINERKGN